MLKEKIVGTVYQVMVRWADIDNGIDGCTVKIYRSYEVAKRAFDELVNQCVNCNYDSAFKDKEKHIMEDGYTVCEGKGYFLVYEDGFSATNYEEITLEEADVYDEE